MQASDVNKLAIGLYQVFWKSGGSSTAAVGMTADGTKWLAPINWTAPDVAGANWGLVAKVVRLNDVVAQHAFRVSRSDRITAFTVNNVHVGAVTYSEQGPAELLTALRLFERIASELEADFQERQA